MTDWDLEKKDIFIQLLHILYSGASPGEIKFM